MVGTYDGSAVTVWVDGALKKSVSPGSFTLSSKTTGYEIGGNCGGTGSWYNGTIDDVRVYNRALSASEIATLYLIGGGSGGGGCSNPTGTEGQIIYNGDYHAYQFCNGINWIGLGRSSGGGGGGCSNPTGTEHQIIYNGDYHAYQFCNGTNWVAFSG